METSGFRLDHNHHQSHVPQQSRRDKLRVQQVLSSTPILIDHNNTNLIDHHHHHQIHEFTLQQEHLNSLRNNNVRHNNSNNNNNFHYNNFNVVPSEIPQSFIVNNHNNWPSSNNANEMPYRNHNDDQVVTVASIRSSENELALLPFSFTNVEDNEDHDHEPNNNMKGLSLSLSSINPNNQQSSDSDRSEKPKPSIIGKASGKSLQEIVGVSSSSGYNRSNAGPLGPFTGYATILRSSRFLRPAQQLLEEFCGSKFTTLTNIGSENISCNISSNNNNNSSGSSSSTFYGSNNDQIGSSSRPEHAQHKKAKLLYMQEEVSRKYKQYRQQMQMVVSSFESVAGLSSATPYISLALKAVSKHFRCLKNAIADQLSSTRRALGEDFLSPGSTTPDHALNANIMEQHQQQDFQKHNRPNGPGVVFHESQQNHHVWRPQRGLPERSVAVLRAWLFEHFLHPYPTDTDKHMLATQTGLTRNQVSNWFINARVRVWKPMVEEIHTLETKGQTTDQQSNKIGEPSSSIINNDHHNQAPRQIGNRMLGNEDEQSHEKRSRLDCLSHSQAPMTSSVVHGFVPYHNHRAGLEVWNRADQ